jgi:hypothetical protein
MRAVMAELLTTGHELIVRSAAAGTSAAVEVQLEIAGSASTVVGAVSVVRENDRGLALVYTPREGLVRLEVDATQGTVAESQLALRVVEAFRSVDIPEPSSPAIEPPKAPPVTNRAKADDSVHDLQLWFGFGAIVASDVETPLPWVVLSAALTLAPALAIEATLGAGPVPSRVTTSAGDLDLRAEQVAVYSMFDPHRAQNLGVAFGIGGGAVFLHETARANPGFTARDDSAFAGVIGARARAFIRAARTSFILTLEPGLLLPAPAVRTGDTEVGSIGQPWIAATLGAGVSL